MAEIPAYPLYNRTYLLYRVSPLCCGDAQLLNERVLQTHAQRLKSQLKGDNIRGVEVDNAGTQGALAELGPLEQCTWDTIGDEDEWINRHRHLVDPEASQLSSSSPPEHARGIQVTLEYERNAYNALLLRDPGSTTSPDGFTSLPLLMLKMPVALRTLFIHYLETAFDAHISPLRLPSSFLTNTLETYFRHLAAPNSSQSIRDVIRQLQLQLSFLSSTAHLKHIDLTLSSNDVPGFVKRGKLLRPPSPTPFTSALSLYLQNHLALHFPHPQVVLSKISCASFTLSTDRLRLGVPESSDVSFISDADSPDSSPSQLALQDFYVSLVKEATGTGRFLPDDIANNRTASSTPSSEGNARIGGARKRAVSTTAPTNAQAKRSKARGKENSRATQDVSMRDA
jgi:hypothetical protein